MSGMIEGKTPWEFACDWYRPDDIERSIRLARHSIVDRTYEGSKVPVDVYSQEFAGWLALQYRLAMTKGIQLGMQARASEPTPFTD